MTKTPEIYYLATAFDKSGNHFAPETETDLTDVVALIDGGWCRLDQVWQFERRADGTYSATDANEIVARSWLDANTDWVVSGGEVPDFVHEHAADELAEMLADEPERPEREEHGTLHFGGSGVL